MTNETKNVPELRFPEFEREWEERKIGNYIVEIKKYDTQQHSSYSVATSSRRGLFKQAEYFDGNRVFSDKEVLYSVVPPNTITYRHMSDDNIFKFNINSFNESVLVSREYPVFDVNDYADKNFVFYELNNSSNFLKFCIKQKKGGTRTRLYFKVLENYETFYPEKTEQQKIGEFFSKLDRQIELEEQKLAKLEEQKKGYMQKLFSQELRFKDQDGNDYPKWEKKFIKDIFIFENNRRKPITSSLREKGLYPYYGATGIIDYVKDYLFNNEERLLIGEDGAKWGQFENSSFIANGQYWVNNHAHVVKSNNHNLYFMNYYLNFKELRTFVTGNAPAKLTHANLCNINLEIPCLNEQDKISALLKSIDKKMNNQINKIVLLKRRKQGLLQKMFV